MNVDKDIKLKVPVLSSVLTIDVDAVDKATSKLAEDVEDVVIRAVKEVTPPKTFQWCVPFLPRFWVSRKEE
jgi:hypothetical protein